MKTYEHDTFKKTSANPLARGPLSTLKRRLLELLPAFEQRLGEDFTLLVNFPLPGTDIHVPLVLTGPPGIEVILPVELRGSYRARGGEWLAYNVDKNSFTPSRPNLMTRAAAFAQAVRKYLAEQQLEPQVVEPVLLFTDPTITVDTARPDVRVVVRAGVDPYVYTLSAAPRLIRPETLFQINTALMRGRSATVPRPANTPPTGGRAPVGGRNKWLPWLLLGGVALLAAVFITLYLLFMR